MKTTFTSTSAMAQATRLTMLKLQWLLSDAQKEVSTGRLADVGAALGGSTGQSVSLRQEQTRLQAMMDSNGSVATRLEATQSALQAIGQDAQSFLNQLAAAPNGNIQSVLQGEAKSSLSALIGDLCERGLDKDVAVVVWGEMGRTPRVGTQKGTTAGRDHWPQSGFALLAGKCIP